MKIFGFVGRVAKPFVDVPRWIGAKRLIQDGKYVKDIAQNVFTPEKSKNSESFDQAMSRLNLTEHDIQARKKQCGLLANIFCSVSIL